MEEKVLAFIRQNHLFDPGDRVLLAVSGGIDSVVMVVLLKKLSASLQITLSAAHVHHHIRGPLADRDAAFTEGLMKELKIPLTLCHKDVPAYREDHALSLEEAARVLRYQALEETAREKNCNKIALAHHENDQAETVLFHLIRGSGLRGLSGMQPVRDGRFVRPLLCLSREEIFAFAQERQLHYCQDETNEDTAYSRNEIRKNVLPALAKDRPDAVEQIARTADYLGEVDQYLRKEAEDWLSRFSARGNRIPAEPFLKADPVLQDYILAGMLRQEGISLKDRNRQNLRTIASLAEKAVGKQVRFRDFIAFRDYDSIFLVTGQKDRGKDLPPEFETRLLMADPRQKIPQKEYTKWVDYDKIKGTIGFRHREPGDRIATAPGAHKSLNNFLTDCKVPIQERDRIWIFADGQDVVWIPGIRLSEDYKITDQTKRILEIRLVSDSGR